MKHAPWLRVLLITLVNKSLIFFNSPLTRQPRIRFLRKGSRYHKHINVYYYELIQDILTHRSVFIPVGFVILLYTVWDLSVLSGRTNPSTFFIPTVFLTFLSSLRLLYWSPISHLPNSRLRCRTPKIRTSDNPLRLTLQNLFSSLSLKGKLFLSR